LEIIAQPFDKQKKKMKNDCKAGSSDFTLRLSRVVRAGSSKGITEIAAQCRHAFL
jgi:hypothetical protein